MEHLKSSSPSCYLCAMNYVVCCSMPSTTAEYAQYIGLLSSDSDSEEDVSIQAACMASLAESGYVYNVL